MELHAIPQFIGEYGYWIAVPIMIIEGPIITLLMGFLSSLGLFNIFIVIALGVISDLVSDAIYYWSGYASGPKVLEKLKIPLVRDNTALQKLKSRFEEHPGKIFFGAKGLTGIAHRTFVLAGVTRVDYEKILKFTIPGGIVWSSALGLLGFYFGAHTTDIGKFLSGTGLVLFGLLILFLFYKFWFGRYLAQKYAVWKEKKNGN